MFLLSSFLASISSSVSIKTELVTILKWNVYVLNQGFRFSLIETLSSFIVALVLDWLL